MALWVHINNNINIFLALRLSLFNSISIMTGTGYSTENFQIGDTLQTQCF